MHIIYMHLYAKLLNRNDMQLPKYLFPHAHREYSQGSLGIKVTQNKTSWKFGQHSGLLYIYVCFFVNLPNNPDAPWCWYIYLQNWVILFGQMLVCIFQHHGASG